jgi:predicted Zn-dependent peptidase
MRRPFPDVGVPVASGRGPFRSPAAALTTALLCVWAPSGAEGQVAEAVPGDISFEELRLGNGLHVILAPDPTATAVAVNLWYDVGSRHERPGRSGFAHLFEHLMFQGSANVAAGEHFRYVERAGGTLNANITEDRTIFYEIVPPERLNLALWLEADRMRSLHITEENMRREVEVVKEERRRSYDNAPYGGTQLRASYYAPYDSVSCFAYAHSVIGSFEDLDAAELPDVQEFFDRYYSPSNATLAIVGAFEVATARDLVEAYFGEIPAGNEPPDPMCEEPFSRLPVNQAVPDPNAVLPAIFLSYGTVPRDHPDAPALDVLSRILADGQSSRLYRRLVRDEQAAVQVGGYSNARRGPGLLQLFVVSSQGVSAERLVELLNEEVDRMVSEGVDEEELARAKNQVEADVVLGRQSVMGRAEALQSANHFYGSPAAVRRSVERIREVTADRLRAVAASYLTPDNRAILRTQPTAGTGGAP